MEHKRDLKAPPEINDFYLRKLEAPEINKAYLNYICERDLTFFRKLLGEMKQETLDLIASGVLDNASEKLKRMREKGRRKNEKQTPPGVAEEDENDDGNKNSGQTSRL